MTYANFFFHYEHYRCSQLYYKSQQYFIKTCALKYLSYFIGFIHLLRCVGLQMWSLFIFPLSLRGIVSRFASRQSCMLTRLIVSTYRFMHVIECARHRVVLEIVYFVNINIVSWWFIKTLFNFYYLWNNELWKGK